MEPQCKTAPHQQHQRKLEETPQEYALEANITTAAAPPTTVTPDIQKTVENCIRRTNSCTDTKYKCTITSDRLAQLRKMVETAIREHKVFTIKGTWSSLRQALLKRNWMEKWENNNTKKPITAPPQNLEDLMSNLPTKQQWETQAAYNDKCEKTIMSRLLQAHDVDFYWNMRKDASDWHHRLSSGKIMSRFSRSLYTSKEGLALLLQQMYWHNEPGVASVNFPRCYVLGFPDHFNNFVDDFRLTACVGLLKWFTSTFENDDYFNIRSPEGKVPMSALQFAIDRCYEHVAKQKHYDIDKEFVKIWDHEWDQFLTHFYAVIHQNALLLDSKDHSLSVMNAAAKTILRDLQPFWPDMNIDGMKNIWILKPGNKCRGRGIQLVKHLEDVVKIMNLKLKYVVQKYIERPLIIYKTKFDIRQWFMVSNVQPLVIWMYRESYLRFSSQIFSLENFHESLHLTNHAVQCKYTNVLQRDKALPDENMWDCYTFQAYLKQIGHANKWNEVIFPGMREGIIAAMLASQDTMDRRPNTFELYGADFMLAEDFQPWLIEINSSPDLSYSTSVTARMCPQVLEDLIKVLIDKRKDPKAETGHFEMIYKQTLPRAPAYLGMSLSVKGRKIFKNRLKYPKNKEKERDKENFLKAKDSTLSAGNVSAVHNETIPIMSNLQKILSTDLYKGPIIHDLIEEIQNSFQHYGEESGVDFIPAVGSDETKKTIRNKLEHQRVSKSPYVNNENKVNHSILRKNVNENNRINKTKSNKLTSGAFKEWNVKSKMRHGGVSLKKTTLWNKETSSIQKGKRKLTKLSEQVGLNVDNKNSVNSPRFFSSYNYLMPKSTEQPYSPLFKNFMTIGLGINANKNKPKKEIDAKVT